MGCEHPKNCSLIGGPREADFRDKILKLYWEQLGCSFSRFLDFPDLGPSLLYVEFIQFPQWIAAKCPENKQESH